MEKVGGNEVVGILRELVLSQTHGQAVDRCWGQEKEKQATNDLQDSIEALEDNPNQESLVEQVLAFEPAHAQLTRRHYAVGAMLPVTGKTMAAFLMADVHIRSPE